MYIILDSLVKMLAPMICYTTEEIWSYMPHKKEENTESVMLNYWPEVNSEYENHKLEEKWNHILELKEMVAKELEVARSEKIIGHSLNAKVTIFADEKEYEFLKENQEQLETVFIVSDLQIEAKPTEQTEKLAVKVEVAEGEKCERCWKYSTTVGEDKENPTICHRCSKSLHE